METIKTNQNALEQRILSEIKRAFLECKQGAEQGKKHIYFTTDRDIQKEVRNKLDENHKIYVPYNCEMSKYSVEHLADKSTMKLIWLD